MELQQQMQKMRLQLHFKHNIPRILPQKPQRFNPKRKLSKAIPVRQLVPSNPLHRERMPNDHRVMFHQLHFRRPLRINIPSLCQ